MTPIALPVDAAISYYESSALPWERAAFIRAGLAAGDARLGRYFLEALHPFVWRRSLDFGAIGEIQSLTRRIRDHYAEGQGFGPGFDLKRGRGGIREVEFFVQIHQLIHGGRQPELREPGTLGALAALAGAGRIAATDEAALREAYRLLRTVEHRLQMVDDLQTHMLPRDPGALDNVARLHGLGEAADLLDLLRPHTAEGRGDLWHAGRQRRAPPAGRSPGARGQPGRRRLCRRRGGADPDRGLAGGRDAIAAHRRPRARRSRRCCPD